MLRIFALLPVLLFSTGCGLLFQTAIGWNSQEVVQKTERNNVQVTSTPPGAEVYRRGPDGQEVPLGRAPITDSVSYEVEETVESPKVWGLITGAALETAGSIYLLRVDGDTAETFLARFGAGVIIATMLIPDVVVGIVHGAGGSSVKSRRVSSKNQDYLYAGRLNGYPDGLALLKVPEQRSAQLILGQGDARPAPGKAPDTAPAVPAAPAPAGLAKQRVVAVMDVEDLSGASKATGLDPELLRSLSDQIRVYVAQTGTRVVDRSSQDRALHEQISQMKKESYKTCYDDSCQIELGKALAASHILRARVARFGKRCVLNAELIDLRAEVTTSAATSQGDCEAEGFLQMSMQVSTQLSEH